MREKNLIFQLLGSFLVMQNVKNLIQVDSIGFIESLTTRITPPALCIGPTARSRSRIVSKRLELLRIHLIDFKQPFESLWMWHGKIRRVRPLSIDIKRVQMLVHKRRGLPLRCENIHH